MKYSIVLVFFSLIFASGNTFSQSKAPIVPEIGSVEIVNCSFLQKYQTEEFTVTESAGYRIALLTLRIEKEPGTEIQLAAADLTLHYYYGENGNKEEVAPCDGISAFSRNAYDDKPIKTSRNAPGWLKKTTGAHTTASSVVYVDVVFRKIEHNISKMWICIAKPAASKSSSGWVLNDEDRSALEQK